MIRILIALFLTLSISFCTNRQSTSIEWKAEDVIGLTMSKDDGDKQSSYEFMEGDVLISWSSEKEGWATSNVIYWEIVDGILCIGQAEKLTLVSKSTDKIVVRNTKGKVSEYTIEKSH